MSNETNNPSSEENSKDNSTLGDINIQTEAAEEQPKTESPSSCCGSCS